MSKFGPYCLFLKKEPIAARGCISARRRGGLAGADGRVMARALVAEAGLTKAGAGNLPAPAVGENAVGLFGAPGMIFRWFDAPPDGVPGCGYAAFWEAPFIVTWPLVLGVFNPYQQVIESGPVIRMACQGR